MERMKWFGLETDWLNKSNANGRQLIQTYRPPLYLGEHKECIAFSLYRKIDNKQSFSIVSRYLNYISIQFVPILISEISVTELYVPHYETNYHITKTVNFYFSSRFVIQQYHGPIRTCITSSELPPGLIIIVGSCGPRLHFIKSADEITIMSAEATERLTSPLNFPSLPVRSLNKKTCTHSGDF